MRFLTVLLLLVASAGVEAKPTSKQLQDLSNAVAEGLRDPASAQFRKIERVDTSTDRGSPGEGIYCGEVNAKNAFGGYVGFMPFMGAILDTDALVIEVASDQSSAAIVNELCRKSRAGEI